MKLRRRLPESRSRKKERLASERDLRRSDRDLALQRKERWLKDREENLAVWKEWRRAVNRRLDSSDDYARFEDVHRRLWDFFRHAWMPDAETTISLQRYADGLPVDWTPVLERVAAGPRRGDRVLWRLLRRAELSASHREMLVPLVVRVVDLPYWHTGFPELARLARHAWSDGLASELAVRAVGGGGTSDRVRAVIGSAGRGWNQETPVGRTPSLREAAPSPVVH